MKSIKKIYSKNRIIYVYTKTFKHGLICNNFDNKKKKK